MRDNYPLGRVQRCFLLLMAEKDGTWTPESPWSYAPPVWTRRILSVFVLRGLVEAVDNGEKYRLTGKGWNLSEVLRAPEDCSHDGSSKQSSGAHETKGKKMTRTYRPTANPANVNQALESYADENGRLSKAQICKGSDGLYEVGGYKVSRGGGPGLVAVRWIAPDDMSVVDIPENLELYLLLYTKILESEGYIVTRQPYGLSVRKP